MDARRLRPAILEIGRLSSDMMMTIRLQINTNPLRELNTKSYDTNSILFYFSGSTEIHGVQRTPRVADKPQHHRGTLSTASSVCP